jgi:hypothetical protein
MPANMQQLPTNEHVQDVMRKASQLAGYKATTEMTKLHALGKATLLMHGGVGLVLACKECRREFGDEEEVQHCGKSFSKEQVLLMMSKKNSSSSTLWEAHKGGYTLCMECSRKHSVGLPSCRVLRVTDASVDECNGRYDFNPVSSTFQNRCGSKIGFCEEEGWTMYTQSTISISVSRFYFNFQFKTKAKAYAYA